MTEPGVLRTLTDDQLGLLARQIEAEQLRRVLGPSDENDASNELVVTSFGCFRNELVKCGKERCRCSHGGDLHGPYWYRYYWVHGKQRKKYVGKQLPVEVQTELEVNAVMQ